MLDRVWLYADMTGKIKFKEVIICLTHHIHG